MGDLHQDSSPTDDPINPNKNSSNLLPGENEGINRVASEVIEGESSHQPPEYDELDQMIDVQNEYDQETEE